MDNDLFSFSEGKTRSIYIRIATLPSNLVLPPHIICQEKQGDIADFEQHQSSGEEEDGGKKGSVPL